MKLLIVTAVAQFRDQVHELFKKANIESFSGSGIDGYKSSPALLKTSSWFPGEVGGVESQLFLPLLPKKRSVGCCNCSRTLTKTWRPTTP